MQLVLSNNRIIAHGENFLAMGGVVINTETGAKYENATIAECENCPSDIDKVGYEYHAGVFVPCAPFGLGNNNGYFMEVCESCATPRSSGIPILGGLKKKNLDLNDINTAFFTLLWKNASPTSAFAAQTITLSSADYDFLFIEYQTKVDTVYYRASATVQRPSTADYKEKASLTMIHSSGQNLEMVWRYVYCDNSYSKLYVGEGEKTPLYKGSNSHTHNSSTNNSACYPIKIYGVKL